jgi:5-methylcytosine-specific restriction protein B
MAETKQGRSVTFRGEEHWVTKEDILSVAAREAPRRVNSYFVEIGGKRYPPKQLVRAATGTKQFFDTGAAVRLLQALGFTVQSETPSP